MNQADLINQLQGLLSDPEMSGKLKTVLGALGGASAPPAVQTPEENGADMTQKIKQVYDRMNNGSDPRVSLLRALRPYMNSTRATQLDTAVRLLGLTNMSSLFKDL